MNSILAIVSMFAGPIGGLVNKGIGIASTAALTWMIAKGVPATDASAIVSEVAIAASTVISMAARSQGIQIDRINAADNGVKVVAASSAGAPVNAPLK